MDGKIITDPRCKENDNAGMGQMDKDEFKATDYQVMGLAFQIQNDLGRMLSESIYRDELLYRLRDCFDNVQVEVPITISFDTFSKTFFADLVVESQVVYELKTVAKLAEAHRFQLLQYLLMKNLNYGKLINFRSSRVEGEFVSTRLNAANRRQLSINKDSLSIDSNAAFRFVELTTGMLREWGGFLSVQLFYDALGHFFGNDASNVQPIAIHLGGRMIGRQNVHLLTQETAFKITAMTRNIDDYRKELTAFMDHTHLRSIQWLNMNHHQIVYETIRN